MVRTRAPLRRVAAVAAGLLLAVTAAGVAVVLRGEQASGPRAPAYRISYAVEDLTTGRRTTELLDVDRPRVSRRLLGGDGSGGGSATTASGVYDRVDNTWRQLAVVPPGEPGQDLQLTAALAWAQGEQLVSRDGAGSVAGVACIWWLTREPLDVGSFAPSTATDRARSCVDERGRLLADTWRAGGQDVRRRTATAVGDIAGVDAFDGGTRPVIDPRLATTVVQLLATPGIDLVRPPTADVVAAARTVEVTPGTADVVRRTQRAVYLVDGVVMVVDQIRDADGPPALRGDRQIVSRSLGTGRVRATGAGLVIEFAVGEGLLRVRSGLSLDRTVDWLAGFQVV